MVRKENVYVRAAMAFVALVALYLLLGVAAYLVPDAPVRRHVERTIVAGDLREQYPNAIIPHGRYMMDNYTDALIVNQALHLRSEGLKGVLLVPHYEVGEDQCTNLAEAVAGGEKLYRVHYGRYWHGSTFVARILLSVMSFMGIRNLLWVATSLLLLWCVLVLWNRVSKADAVALVVGLLSVSVYVMQFSLQYAPVLMIALGGVIWVSYHEGAARGEAWLLFAVIGSLTAYFDLLTVPTLSFGLPLLALVSVWRQAGAEGSGVRIVARMVVWWAVFYVLTWVAKLGMATVLTGEDVLGNAYGQAASWTEGGVSYMWPSIRQNMGHVRWIVVLPVLLATLALAALAPSKGRSRVAAVYLLVAFVPIVYYLLMPHASCHHANYNYRALATTVSALLLAAAEWVDWKRLERRRNG